MLKHQILDKIKKRDDGETVLNLFPVVISAVVLLALVVIYATWIANVDKKDSVDQIIRKYALKLETVGYLDEEDGTLDKMLEELRDAGMENPTWRVKIPVAGGELLETTIEPKSYGNPIYLIVSGEIILNDPKLIAGGTDSTGGIYSVIEGTDRVTYTVIKQSTSKRSADY